MLDQAPNSSPETRQAVSYTELQLYDEDRHPREGELEYVSSNRVSYNTMLGKETTLWHSIGPFSPADRVERVRQCRANRRRPATGEAGSGRRSARADRVRALGYRQPSGRPVVSGCSWG